MVEHAVSFEWRWFRDRLEAGTYKLDDTSKFLREALGRHHSTVTSSSSFYKPSSNPSITVLFNEGLIYLISSACKLPEMGVPETLHLDATRLVTFYNDWQDITIMGALLILFKQAAGVRCSSVDLSNIKQQLWVLLNDSETSLQHVSLQMVSAAGKVRGRPFSNEESALLCGMVDRTLAPKAALYELLQKRVGWHLLDYLNNSKLDGDSMTKHGLQELEEEVSDLARRIQKVMEFNKVVYGPIYNALLQDILSDDDNSKGSGDSDSYYVSTTC